MSLFKIKSEWKPSGDQPKAIESLIKGLEESAKYQVLLGVTGSGKTFTIANVIEKVQKPTLVIAPNKTLAAQLAQEFRSFFPGNAVEYFVSYYDYYQPEAYIASSDTYIEKETQINDEIDRLRHAATAAILTRRDTIIVASVSCIYGLGSPSFYLDQAKEVHVGDVIHREQLIKKLVSLQYSRSDILERSKFRAVGDTIEIMSPSREIVTRIVLEKGKVSSIKEYDAVNREELSVLESYWIFPAKHFVVPERMFPEIIVKIGAEAKAREDYFTKKQKFLEAQRIRTRTQQDLEMLKEVGYCSGIENYSRYLTGRAPGEVPYTLMDYFPKDYLLVIDESHVTIPQLHGMYGGDFSRKKNLIEHGFRLPSAFDNRPLKYEEFQQKENQVIYVSATPKEYEYKMAEGRVAEQIIRPTGLIDPEIIIKSAKGQVRDIQEEIAGVVGKGNRVLVTTLTQKMAENLAEFLQEHKIKTKYLHAGVETLDRIRILEGLRRGEFDVLVGVNLLREGLDLPEVALVGILDADREGFLRSATSLIQTIGRAARNLEGRVVLYADKMTDSMRRAIDETNRRRVLQLEYNRAHKITPKTIIKNIASIVDREINPEVGTEFVKLEQLEDIDGYIKIKEKEMKAAAKSLEFERAALIRDEIHQLRKLQRKMR
ncbi:MAG: excinuclease ABC subunit B [Parcubacteria group bacterium Gr01-1014_18]|nr:MAG: excinuclease ABC subunit B [Parcubacteria group bacterium Greene0416_36]TSC81485.1 MAG: excinuclease ABC subunit B [Parcubacteria group bacterium Gr01-1014_18]TSC99083.1 MAG: excinuclease ABC subunit B [Parcubacteria group bacterium Greene1014_20]TSD07237.1 MAG: excinuclease ABC subunit B [Parcubacteria group bacterium Greene0714_2]